MQLWTGVHRRDQEEPGDTAEKTPSSMQAGGRGEMKKSAIAEHASVKQHHPEWDSISILNQARNNRVLLVKEALHISLAGQHMLLNRYQGTAISDCETTVEACDIACDMSVKT